MKSTNRQQAVWRNVGYRPQKVLSDISAFDTRTSICEPRTTPSSRALAASITDDTKNKNKR